MSTTPNTGLELVPQNTADPYVAVNDSFQTIDALMSLTVVSMTVSAPPATTSADIGKRWVIGASPTGAWAGRADQIALCTAAGLWRYYVPWVGLVAWSIATSAEYRWTGSAWTATGGGGGGVPEAPVDGGRYVRKDAAWAPEATGVPEAPEDGQQYARQDGAWEPVTASGGGIPDAPSDGSTYGRKDGGWVAVPGGVTNNMQVITEGSAFTVVPATHAGRHRLILAGGNVTFGTSGVAIGQCYNIRSTGAVALVGSGVTLTPTDGGSLAMTANMQVTVVMTSGTTGIVMGLTVAP